MAGIDPSGDLALQPHSFQLAELVEELSSSTPGKRSSYVREVGKLITSQGFGSVSQPGAVALPTAFFVRELAGRATRDLNAGTASEGGDLIAGRMIDVARAARSLLALDAAGVPRIELRSTGPVSFARWNPETSLGGWCAEGGTSSGTDITVSEVTAMPRSAYASVRITRRLRLQTSFDVEQSLLLELAAAGRHTLEHGLLNGESSASKPLGLLHVPGASSVTWAAADYPTRSEVVEMIEAYAAAYGNLSQARFLASSALIAKMLVTESASGTAQFVLAADDATPRLIGVPVIISEAMPADRLLLLDPTQQRLVFWGAPAAIVDRMKYALQGDSELHVYNDCDVVSINPAQICIGKGAA